MLLLTLTFFHAKLTQKQFLSTNVYNGYLMAVFVLCCAGMSYSVGSLQRKGMKASEDGETVALLKAAGGIPLLVSNTPEYCTSWESSNLIIGRSLNPYDTRRSSGGSSGGEVCFHLIYFYFNDILNWIVFRFSGVFCTKISKKVISFDFLKCHFIWFHFI